MNQMRKSKEKKQILELRNAMTALPTSLESFKSRLDHAVASLSGLERKTSKLSSQRNKQRGENRGDHEESLKFYETVKRNNTHIIDIQKEEGTESIFKAMTENFPSPGRETDIQNHEAHKPQ